MRRDYSRTAVRRTPAVKPTRSSPVAYLVVGWDTLLGASDSWDPYEPAPTI